ncbi:reverse transcriptase domain-containing protein [Faecalicatena contorta]|uniref:reverse transcriptase domain-containing protein n=1 Tax=Faecalicatena contorta TaxID=39482 RepID=UPI0006DCD951|nr:reverse transcriptase domain-containing protein [Faecalicatena contorta]
MKRNFPRAPFERYADDGVVHCSTKEEALYIKEKLAKRFEKCKLELHPVKTRIVYCKDKDRTRDEELTEFDFLGYTFKAVYIPLTYLTERSANRSMISLLLDIS